MIPAAHLQAAVHVLGARGETTLCPISGNCMTPLLRDGDDLLIQYGNSDIRVGDIVVFGSPGDLCVHRVVRVGSGEAVGTFVVKGDLRTNVLTTISRDEILGKVIEAHGSNGQLRLRSAIWRRLNHLLWLRSYVRVWHYQAGPVLWIALNLIFLLRTRLLPRKLSISLLPIRAMCGLNKLWTELTLSRLGTKAEG